MCLPLEAVTSVTRDGTGSGVEMRYLTFTVTHDTKYLEEISYTQKWKNEEVDKDSLLEGNSMSWKRVPAWVPGALITILVWLFVLYIILNYFPIEPEQQPILVFVTVSLFLICLGSVLYYFLQTLFGTRYNPEI